MTKQDHSPVTVADMGIQAIAGVLLEQYFPKACLVAEENSSLLQGPEGKVDLDRVTRHVKHFFPGASSETICAWIDRGAGISQGTFWTLDPIDGTKGFLRGGQYVTALAFIDQGQVQFSALGCPQLELPGHAELGRGVLFLAERGKGCWLASLEGDGLWSRARVSPCRDITQARILDSFDPRHKNSEKNVFIRKKLGTRPEPVAVDSQAKHAILASGGAEIFFRTLPARDPCFREKIWDVAPGAFAIEEAGGRVTDLSGNPIDYSAGIVLERNPGFLATNGPFHDAILAAIKEAEAAFSQKTWQTTEDRTV